MFYDGDITSPLDVGELSPVEVILHKYTTEVLNIPASVPKRSRLEANSDFSLSDCSEKQTEKKRGGLLSVMVFCTYARSHKGPLMFSELWSLCRINYAVCVHGCEITPNSKECNYRQHSKQTMGCKGRRACEEEDEDEGGGGESSTFVLKHFPNCLPRTFRNKVIKKGMKGQKETKYTLSRSHSASVRFHLHLQIKKTSYPVNHKRILRKEMTN